MTWGLGTIALMEVQVWGCFNTNVRLYGTISGLVRDKPLILCSEPLILGDEPLVLGDEPLFQYGSSLSKGRFLVAPY